MISPQKIVVFQEKIFERYYENKRDLPRRDTFDPYRVFVSETMLQQTQAERVIPKFEQFVSEVPDFDALANLARSDLMRLRSGLGFNSRALRLQQSAQKVVSEFAGSLPQNRETLLTFPGVGPYTSASILAFAYNLPEPVVDTNIRRVLLHELQLPHDTTSKVLEEIARLCLPEGYSNDRHNALMDYGAIVATAKATGIKPISKQSPFQGSKRQVRGNVMKWLVKYGPTDIQILKQRFVHEAFDQVIADLVNEGLVTQRDQKIGL